MNKNLSLGLFMMNLLFCISAVTAPAPQGGVAALMNQRLSYMKDVAGYKASHHLAIEDLPQEARVLSASVAEAETLGLNGDSIKPFIQAQMDAAKAIQYRYRADWLSKPEQGWQPKPLEQVRSHIGILSTAILHAISARLTQGQTFTDQQAFMHALEQTNLNDGDKQRLWDSLT
ncbi:Secreted chorismate mutase [Sodalis praecaptivus]|nr:chorismate mutase [Sodalis praecaptivus]CAJ0995199.1 Secreted chorismate mutase [Sodalis praecaptivus]